MVLGLEDVTDANIDLQDVPFSPIEETFRMTA